MWQNRRELLDEIQKKREMMMESAKRLGYTSVDTVRHSQELDQLIFDYQCRFQKPKGNKQEINKLLNQMILVCSKAIVNF